MSARPTPLQAALAATAAIVRCRYCQAPPRRPCVNRRAPGHPPTGPHAPRIADARRIRTAGTTPLPARKVAS